MITEQISFLEAAWSPVYLISEYYIGEGGDPVKRAFDRIAYCSMIVDPLTIIIRGKIKERFASIARANFDCSSINYESDYESNYYKIIFETIINAFDLLECGD